MYEFFQIFYLKLLLSLEYRFYFMCYLLYIEQQQKPLVQQDGIKVSTSLLSRDKEVMWLDIQSNLMEVCYIINFMYLVLNYCNDYVLTIVLTRLSFLHLILHTLG